MLFRIIVIFISLYYVEFFTLQQWHYYSHFWLTLFDICGFGKRGRWFRIYYYVKSESWKLPQLFKLPMVAKSSFWQDLECCFYFSDSFLSGYGVLLLLKKWAKFLLFYQKVSKIMIFLRNLTIFYRFSRFLSEKSDFWHPKWSILSSFRGQNSFYLDGDFEMCFLSLPKWM